MNKSAKEIAEAIISGTRLIDREAIHLAYELADAVISEDAEIDALKADVLKYRNALIEIWEVNYNWQYQDYARDVLDGKHTPQPSRRNAETTAKAKELT